MDAVSTCSPQPHGRGPHSALSRRSLGKGFIGNIVSGTEDTCNKMPNLCSYYTKRTIDHVFNPNMDEHHASKLLARRLQGATLTEEQEVEIEEVESRLYWETKRKLREVVLNPN